MIDPEGLRADQVLTSPLFGLQGTRSPEVVKKIDRYAFLFGVPESALSDDEKKEMASLKESLSGMLLHGETPQARDQERADRRARVKTGEAMVAAVAMSTPEEKERLREALEDPEVNA
jgi:hypothetical protein